MENKLERLYEAIVAVGNDIEYHAKEWKLYNALYERINQYLWGIVEDVFNEEAE